MSNNAISFKKDINSLQFKKFFLLEFTRQLIKNSAPSEIFELQTILEKEKKDQIEEKKDKIKEIIEEKKEKIREVIREKEKGVESAQEIPSIMHASIGMFETQKTSSTNPFTSFFTPPPASSRHFNAPQERIRLLIPESRFPAHIEYIKPVPLNKEIELGKINPLINDYKVKIIECYGPGDNLVVQGAMGTKKTGIVLSKEEIDETVQRFSRETRIPIQEGIFKVVVGNLIFLAIISEIVGSKFIIKKMIQEQQLPVYRR